MMDLNIALTFIDWFCVISCLFLKIPQITKLLSNQSAKGLSLRGHVIELFKFCSGSIYHIKHGHPLMTWIEDPFLIVQCMICVLLIIYYQAKPNRVMIVGYTILPCVFTVATVLIFPVWVIDMIQVSFIPAAFFAKWSHLSEMYHTKDTTNVSLINWFLSWTTCIGRLITYSMALKGDIILTSRVLMTMTMNFIGCEMIIYYRPRTEPKPIKTD